MGTSAKTLRRIVWLVEKGHLPIGGRVADIGTQQLRADPEAVGAFIDFFKRKGASILITQSEANRIGKAGYLGELLKAVGFEYVAFDIFDAPDTVLLDLNINFVPEHQRNLFDLVTNFGTTEHVINQMACNEVDTRPRKERRRDLSRSADGGISSSLLLCVPTRRVARYCVCKSV